MEQVKKKSVLYEYMNTCVDSVHKTVTVIYIMQVTDVFFDSFKVKLKEREREREREFVEFRI